jgi:hypothetical protein
MDEIRPRQIQGCMTLYSSRKLRFDDRFRDRYLPLFGLDAALRTLGDRLDRGEAEGVRRRIEEKYARRLAQYAAGEKQWETSVSLVMVLRGVK